MRGFKRQLAPPQRLLLAGFSQGGAITLAAGLARTQPLAGLIALSTYLPMPLALAQPGHGSRMVGRAAL